MNSSLRNESDQQNSLEFTEFFPEFVATVSKKSGKEVIAWFQEKNLIDQKFRIKHENDHILIPLTSQIPLFEANKQIISNYSVEIKSNWENRFQISPRNTTPRNIQEILQQLIPQDLHDIIPGLLISLEKSL